MSDAPHDTSNVSATDGLFGWMLQYLRPYRSRVALLSVLLSVYLVYALVRAERF